MPCREIAVRYATTTTVGLASLTCEKSSYLMYAKICLIDWRNLVEHSGSWLKGRAVHSLSQGWLFQAGKNVDHRIIRAHLHTVAKCTFYKCLLFKKYLNLTLIHKAQSYLWNCTHSFNYLISYLSRRLMNNKCSDSGGVWRTRPWTWVRYNMLYTTRNYNCQNCRYIVNLISNLK